MKHSLLDDWQNIILKYIEVGNDVEALKETKDCQASNTRRCHPEMK